MSRSRAKALGLSVALLPLLAACHSGMNAATLQQDATGNGVELAVAGMTVDNATIVAGDAGSGKAAFLGTLYNPTEADDELVAIAAGGAPATLLPDPVPVPALTAVPIQTGADAQADFAGLDAEAGTYVDVTLVFRNAEQAKFPALVVPPTGFYYEAAPEGTQPVLEEEVVVEEESVEGIAE